MLFADYFDEWVDTYKLNAIADVTLRKYYTTGKFIRSVLPKVTIKDLDRRTYQQLLNKYAETHEKQTTTDFHHQVKGCIQDLFHDGLIVRDPTYKSIVKGKISSRKKKVKFLHASELKSLINTLDLGPEINYDWFIMLMVKTGLRFAEGLALTPADFDSTNRTVSVTKTWDYKKSDAGFAKTKNKSSVRTIALDWQMVGQFMPMLVNLPQDQPIFVKRKENGIYHRIFNSTYNNYLKRKCIEAEIPYISFHALRHTHASILLSAGVSIHSIADRLGHSEISTTQETYTHIINELAQKDNSKMITALTAIA